MPEERDGQWNVGLVENLDSLVTALRARVAELEAALTLIADEQNIYKGYGDYDTVPRYTAEEAQALARRVLSGIKEGDA